MSDPLLQEALERDAKDPLRHFREAFVRDPSTVYLDGNSLGLLPRRTQSLLAHTLDQWGGRQVRAWNDGWIDLPSRLGDRIGALIGAEPGEVLVCDSTSVNFYKLVKAALEVSGRQDVVTDDATFPSNAYVLQSFLKSDNLRMVESKDGIEIQPRAIERELNSETAVLTLNHVAFKSGWMHDMARLNAAAKAVGALNLWDLSHSVGTVPIDLHASGVDLAVVCTYKYLNGGPGAPAFLFVRRDLQARLKSPIQGWFGQARPFDFDLTYEPRDGIRRFMAGTPPILSMAAIDAGVEVVSAAGVEAIRRKSIELTTFMTRLWQERLQPLDVRFKSPSDPAQRGSHISLGHPKAYGLARALIEEMNVVPDFRRPDHIRFGFAPLYSSFQDAWEATDRLCRVIKHRMYERYEERVGEVT